MLSLDPIRDGSRVAVSKIVSLLGFHVARTGVPVDVWVAYQVLLEAVLRWVNTPEGDKSS